MKRLVLLTLVAGALAACNDSPTQPDQPALSAASATPTQLPTPRVIASQSCPTISPTEQITDVIARINASNLSPDLKAQVTASLQNALTALGNRDLSAAISALESVITKVQASGAPQPVKDALVSLLNCLVSQLGA